MAYLLHNFFKNKLLYERSQILQKCFLIKTIVNISSLHVWAAWAKVTRLGVPTLHGGKWFATNVAKKSQKLRCHRRNNLSYESFK